MNTQTSICSNTFKIAFFRLMGLLNKNLSDVDVLFFELDKPEKVRTDSFRSLFEVDRLLTDHYHLTSSADQFKNVRFT